MARAPVVWEGLESAGLDLDFSTADIPSLVTIILAACAVPPGCGEPEDIWGLSLSARIGGLLSVLVSTTATEDLELTMRCAACDEDMEIVLPVGRLIELARRAAEESETVVATPDGPVRLRRPRGSDQRAWRQARPADPEASVLATLVLEGSPKRTALIDEALAGFDPLTCFELDVTCPSCGVRANVDLDLEITVLGELSRVHYRTIQDVAVLARRYGWSEPEVLAIPAWRRRLYRDLGGGAGT
ncbi:MULTISPECIES: hypothetical protein [Citricoccus]|uniref:hypothetical protein n=1 Tax=Citricoccus TaxID=169133 RepID=UPI000255F125|nr:hypothetical protein [Citricoccus sp. CH26A]